MSAYGYYRRNCVLAKRESTNTDGSQFSIDILYQLGGNAQGAGEFFLLFVLQKCKMTLDEMYILIF